LGQPQLGPKDWAAFKNNMAETIGPYTINNNKYNNNINKVNSNIIIKCNNIININYDIN